MKPPSSISGAPEATRSLDADLVDSVLAALDGEKPDACLAAAVAVLSARGFSAPESDGPPWLDLERGAGRLRLFAAASVEPPGLRARVLLEHALGAALARVSELGEARKLREHLELQQAASFDAILVHDQGAALDCNERLVEMFGYGRDEIFEPGHMARVVAPEDLTAVGERIRKGIEGAFLVTCIHKDGRRIRAEFRTRQTQLGDRPVRVVALRDVTDRERAAALIQESEARMRTLLEATFDGVATTQDRGKLVRVSDGLVRFLGIPREKLLGTSVLELVAPAARDEVSRRIQGHTVGAYDALAIAAGGELVPVMVVSVEATLDGEPVRVSAIRDLREARRLELERRQLELQVERSQRLESLGVLASGIAHDFNNLLVGVLGGAEVLLTTLQDPDERAQAEAIRTAGLRAASLTKQMLAYAGRRSLTTTEPVDLAKLWHELRTLLDAALSKKARIELDFAPGSVVLGERSALMQVFMNLLTNASDALEDKPGRIFLTTERVQQPDARWSRALGTPVRSGSWVLVGVRDTGAGMDEATQKRIFEPFFSTKTRGHGLGLGSCLGIIRAHGGAILVDSAPGLGSTFSVLLPATEVRSMSPVRSAAIAPPCRVLVIDDEPLVRSHVVRLLTQRGFKVEDAATGSAGLEAIQRSRPDVVILDMMLPDLNGVEVVQRLRAAGVNVPVVLCSGDLDAARERGLDPGLVQGMLQKPFDPGQLLEAIERARAETTES